MAELNQQNGTDTSIPTAQQQLTPSHIVTALQREHPEWVTEIIEALGETTMVVPREHIVAV